MEKKNKLVKFLKSRIITKSEMSKMPEREKLKSKGYNYAIKEFNNYIESDEFEQENYF